MAQSGVECFGIEGTFVSGEFLKQRGAVICAVEKTDKFAGDRAVDFQGGVVRGRDHVRESRLVTREWSRERAVGNFSDEMRRTGMQINEPDFVATEEKGTQGTRLALTLTLSPRERGERTQGDENQ